MFTGIIETIGEIKSFRKDRQNLIFGVESTIGNELKIDQSVSHDGVCLTVTQTNDNYHEVTAIQETLDRTSLGSWEVGGKINLERCMLNNGRFDGHIVQGHVDCVGEITNIEDQGGSWLFTIKHPTTDEVTVEKGSITINGISLTCFNCSEDSFSVAIIPYTFENTNLSLKKVGDKLNLEFDIIGKYVKRLINK